MTTAAMSSLVGDVLSRGEQAWDLDRQVRRVGGCEQPIRLRGRADVVSLFTGEVRRSWSSETLPDGTVLVACGNRRATRCGPCSRLYQGDAFQLVAAGLRGGKGVPDTVVEHPAVFVTLTAPSFGPVHTTRLTRDGRPAPCRVRRDLTGQTCQHGQLLTCRVRHDEGDPELGQPLCGDCFDYEAAVLWNAHCSQLWRRTRIDLYRQLAKLTRQTERAVRAQVRVSYVKVAEFQRRGLLHFHLALRLDAADAVTAPAGQYTVELLADALCAAAERVRVSYPHPHRPFEHEPALNLDLEKTPQPAAELPALQLHDRGGLREARWGEQIDIRPIPVGEPAEADRAMERGQVAGYLAKYATKHTEALGGLDRRVTPADLPTLPVNPHIGRLVATALLLASYYPPADEDRLAAWADKLSSPNSLRTADRNVAAQLLFTGHAPPRSKGLGERLARWAHQLGYGGHWLTKSRSWSTTFTALRQERRTWQAARNPDPLTVDNDQELIVASWQLAGIGYRLPGDAWLAQLARNRNAAAREAEREERADRRLTESLAA